MSRGLWGLKGLATNFTHEVQLTGHEESSSACDDSIMSSVAWREKMTLLMSSGLSRLGFGPFRSLTESICSLLTETLLSHIMGIVKLNIFKA